jgi:hypothetical protein
MGALPHLNGIAEVERRPATLLSLTVSRIVPPDPMGLEAGEGDQGHPLTVVGRERLEVDSASSQRRDRNTVTTWPAAKGGLFASSATLGTPSELDC